MYEFTTEDAALLLGYEPRTIAKWCREGKIKARKAGNQWLIPESALFKRLFEISKKYPEPQLRAIFKKTEGRCFYCGKKLTFAAYGQVDHPRGWEVDHVHPRAWGGKDKFSNLVAACIYCNRSKGADYKLRHKFRSALLARQTRRKLKYPIWP